MTTSWGMRIEIPLCCSYRFATAQLRRQIFEYFGGWLFSFEIRTIEIPGMSISIYYDLVIFGRLLQVYKSTPVSPDNKVADG